MNKLVVALALGLLAACGSNPAGGGGGDGGVACIPGVDPDCPVDCGAGIYQGCPCDPATDTPVACYEGAAGTESTAPCMKGSRSCDAASATWGACDGQVVPEAEICDNGIDNDCDGAADEDVLSACGNCVPGCEDTGVGDDPFPLPPSMGTGGDGVGLDENGDLVLDSTELELHFLWIANDYEGTVSKIDTRTGQEVARYASVTHESIVDHTGGSAFRTWNQSACGGAHADNRPSRTAIDLHGNVWVANRAHDCGGLQQTATKILNAEVDCVDRNANGTIDTSRDLNANGIIEIGTAEFLAESDECIAFTVVFGGLGGWARAVAIGRSIEPGDPGNAWVGSFNEGAFYELDGKTGALIQRVPETGSLGIAPYGAAIDGNGKLWAPNGCCGNTTLAQIDTLTMPATVLPSVPVPDLGLAGSYGITVDTKNRVWLGAWPNAGLKRYDPVTGEFVAVSIAGLPGSGYGVRGVGIDARGNVWGAIHLTAGGYPQAWAARVNADTATSTGVWDMTATTPVGIGVDLDGHVWTVNQNTSNASKLAIDPGTGEPAGAVTTHPVGPYPYTYSDFTGLGARIVTNPQGEWTQIIQGCGAGMATWLGVDWTSTLPPNTAVEIWVRAGEDLATVNSWPLFGPWTMSPADLQQPPGPVPDATYLQLIIILKSLDGTSSPIVHSYSVSWACGAIP